ncbi:MAG TPA: zinc/iron permease, partial [Patescibacteria group bacterium]|nr:zinc/iron permease [Patescibacteria group bacterium]
MNLFNFSNTFIWISVFALGSILVNALGVWAIFKYRKWAEKAKVYFMCFAAGVLIATPLILALPRAVEKNSYAGFLALLGFLFMFFSNKLLRKYTQERSLAFGLTAAEGVEVHSFIYGIIY